MKRKKETIIIILLAVFAAFAVSACGKENGKITINKKGALDGLIGYPDYTGLPLTIDGIISVDKGKLTKIAGFLYEQNAWVDDNKKTEIFSTSEKTDASEYDLSCGKVGRELSDKLNEVLSKVHFSSHFADKTYFVQIYAEGSEAEYRLVYEFGSRMYLPTPTMSPY